MNINKTTQTLTNAIYRELKNSSIKPINMDILKEAVKKVLTAFFSELTNHHIRIVKNMDGSSKYKLEGNRTWADYWNEKNELKFPNYKHTCDCCNTVQNEFVGGHVVSFLERNIYIYPICKTCNSRYKGEKSKHLFKAQRKWLVPFNKNDDGVYVDLE